MKTGVLYIDDEPANLISFKATFRHNYSIYTASTTIEATSLLQKHQKEIHLIITDQKMPDMSGIEFLSSIIDKYPDKVRIILTGHSDVQTLTDAINKVHIYKYLSKPWNAQELNAIMEKAYDMYLSREQGKQQLEELTELNGRLEFLLGQQLLS